MSYTPHFCALVVTSDQTLIGQLREHARDCGLNMLEEQQTGEGLYLYKRGFNITIVDTVEEARRILDRHTADNPLAAIFLDTDVRSATQDTAYGLADTIAAKQPKPFVLSISQTTDFYNHLNFLGFTGGFLGGHIGKSAADIFGNALSLHQNVFSTRLTSREPAIEGEVAPIAPAHRRRAHKQRPAQHTS